MTSAELTLRFAGDSHVNVAFDGGDSGALPFTNPITKKDREDISWYLETYGAVSLAEPDDQAAGRIEAQLPEIGKALFKAVFSSMEAMQRFLDFRNMPAEQRVLTIDAQDASILSLPWELLHDPTGVFLFRDKPHISIRRRIAGATGGRPPLAIEAKDRLHLLFVVSRPKGTGFIDPRTDPKAVLDALEDQAPGRFTIEFLRPATLNALHERLDDETKPSVDILHFDGHGVFQEVSEEDAKKAPGLFGKSVLSEIQRERQSRGDQASAAVGIGFLVFEREDGDKQLVSAADLGDNLYQSKVMLVVLSACQTAALGEDSQDPMASVAGRLTTTGIPSIIAMTHSVLVATTRMLFGKFYQNLARGRGLASSLDKARIHLANNPDRYEVQRGDQRAMLKLEDWFLPALFHGGANSALLTNKEADLASSDSRRQRGRDIGFLQDEHEAGFFGRRRELWDIERWFAVEGTRRISLTGFGGQGKTELAMEAGRWLTRTGLFEKAVFVNYAQIQTDDVLTVATNAMGAVLDQTFSHADEATDALAQTPTLLILDNLETVSDEALQGLLDAAVVWSEAGRSRVMLTSRKSAFNHADYRTEGTRKHRQIALEGLGNAASPDDAIDWFAALSKLPPAANVPPPSRDALIALFDRVQFHPLSIAVLAQQLKDRTAKTLGERLEALLQEDALSAIAVDGTPKSLIASLQLSLERLTEEERHAVRLLGVFQGGAFEDDLLTITGLGEDDGKRVRLEQVIAALESDDPGAGLREMGMNLPEGAELSAELVDEMLNDIRGKLVDLPAASETNVWPGLRRQLDAAALIQMESIPGIGPPFLRFHPTLAPMLWAQINEEEKADLIKAHRKRYHALTGYLYQEDTKNPDRARAVARRELPNILFAVRRAVGAADPDAVDFADSVNRFLNVLGMNREAETLVDLTATLSRERGSKAWFQTQSNRGEQLYASGQLMGAIEVFSDILNTLGNEQTFSRVVTLARLGRCYEAGGRTDLAEEQHRQALFVNKMLDQNDSVKRLRGSIHTDLGDVLRARGKLAEAREQYEQSLAIKREVKGDLRGEGVVHNQLGTLALAEGKLDKAADRYFEALDLFQRLGEPESEAVIHHQLGLVFRRARKFSDAERHLRRSAELKVSLGFITGPSGAASSWNALAVVSRALGRPSAAETWFQKVIDVTKRADDGAELSKALNNLADLLSTQADRLDEAREFAEEALAIKQTLDPGAAEIWSTQSILADITEQQGCSEKAAEYRRLAREAKRAFAGTAQEMKKYFPVILGTCMAIHEPAKAEELGFDEFLSGLEERGGTNLVVAIRRIISGERDIDALCQQMNSGNSMIIDTILNALEDPSVLEELEPKEEEPA